MRRTPCPRGKEWATKRPSSNRGPSRWRWLVEPPKKQFADHAEGGGTPVGEWGPGLRKAVNCLRARAVGEEEKMLKRWLEEFPTQRSKREGEKQRMGENAVGYLPQNTTTSVLASEVIMGRIDWEKSRDARQIGAGMRLERDQIKLCASTASRCNTPSGKQMRAKKHN